MEDDKKDAPKVPWQQILKDTIEKNRKQKEFLEAGTQVGCILMDEQVRHSPELVRAMFELILDSSIPEKVVLPSSARITILDTEEIKIEKIQMDPEDFLGYPLPLLPPKSPDERKIWNIAKDAAMNSLVLGDELKLPIETCGIQDQKFVWNPTFAIELDEKRRKLIAHHERMHIEYARWETPEQKQAALDAVAEMERFAVSVDEKLKTAVSRAVETTKVQVVQRVEAPCRQCSRQNDIGCKKCWWCEVQDPTRDT